MKKKIIFGLLTLVLFTSMTGCGKTKKKAENNPVKDETKKIDEKIDNGTVEQQGDFIVQNVKIEELGASSVVSGTITNKSDSVKSVTVLLKMIKMSTSQLFGIANIDIDEINAGETREFSLSMVGDYSNVDYFDVTINER